MAAARLTKPRAPRSKRFGAFVLAVGSRLEEGVKGGRVDQGAPARRLGLADEPARDPAAHGALTDSSLIGGFSHE